MGTGAGGGTGTVRRALSAALHSDDDASLDTGASLLAADPSADTELAAHGEQLLRAAWRRGWAPADVVRLVRRDLAEPHLRLAARLIRAETRRYDRLPPRWPGQLRQLPQERGPDARTDRFAQASAVLELYRLLLRLPPVEPVGPVPGAAVAEPVAGEPRALARIRALLAKAEATGFPEEAEALSAKAQELMTRQGVDAALLAARTRAADAPDACRIGVDTPYETAKAVLLDAVATANRCRAVWNGDLGFSTVVGFAADLDAVELLYTSLLVQATAAMTRAEAAQRAGGRRRTKTFRQSFLAAYAHRIGDRLTAAARTATTAGGDSAAAGPGTGERVGPDGDLLPVLAARDAAVEDRTGEMFPQTVGTRLRGVTDGAGWADGTNAADRAALHHRTPVRGPGPSGEA